MRGLTDGPFGVDILFATVRTTGQETEAFTDAVRGWIDVALEERVPVLIVGLGNPGPVTAEAHRLGITVTGLCGNVKQARDPAANDVDVIIAQGHEGGGHTGRVGGVVLTPAVRSRPARWSRRAASPMGAGWWPRWRSNGSAAAGQSAALIHDVRPAGEVVASLVEEAEAILAGLGRSGA